MVYKELCIFSSEQYEVDPQGGVTVLILFDTWQKLRRVFLKHKTILLNVCFYKIAVVLFSAQPVMYRPLWDK